MSTGARGACFCCDPLLPDDRSSVLRCCGIVVSLMPSSRARVVQMMMVVVIDESMSFLNGQVRKFSVFSLSLLLLFSAYGQTIHANTHPRAPRNNNYFTRTRTSTQTLFLTTTLRCMNSTKWDLHQFFFVCFFLQFYTGTNVNLNSDAGNNEKCPLFQIQWRTKSANRVIIHTLHTNK